MADSFRKLNSMPEERDLFAKIENISLKANIIESDDSEQYLDN